MILVDTSVLIDFLRGRQNPKVDLLDALLERHIPWGINELVFQEVLQGARDEAEFERLREYLDSIPLYSLKNGKASYEAAAHLNLRCRTGGVTVRSTIDLLIATTALEHDLSLLHNDGDFDNMARVEPNLRIFV